MNAQMIAFFGGLIVGAVCGIVVTTFLLAFLRGIAECERNNNNENE